MDQIVEKPDTLIGAAFPKPDAPDKVVGKTTYINDMVLPRMLVAKIKRTDRVHAKILSVDISEAEKVPGIVAIATAENSPKGLIGVLKDNPPLKGDKVVVFGTRSPVSLVRPKKLSTARLSLSK